MTTALILAAGRGERVGGPKALLELEGRPLAALHAERRLSTECERVVIVVRADVARALAPHLDRVDPARAIVVESSAPDPLGPAGSIAAAVEAGVLDDAPADAVLITPVDVLPANAAATAPLLDALATHEAARWARGHPVAMHARTLLARYAPNAPPQPLRDVLASLGDRCAILPLSPAIPIGHDLDTPDDVLRATGAPPRFAR